jgi:hypothetical protein
MRHPCRPQSRADIINTALLPRRITSPIQSVFADMTLLLEKKGEKKKKKIITILFVEYIFYSDIE